MLDRQQAGKIPYGVSIKTIHGLGRDVLYKHFRPRDSRNWLDTKKYQKLTRYAWDDLELSGDLRASEFFRDAVEATEPLVRFAMLTLTTVKDDDTLFELASHFGVELPPPDYADEMPGVIERVIRWGQNGMAIRDKDGLNLPPVRADQL